MQKKIIVLTIIIIMTIPFLMGFTHASIELQDTAHKIAELARSLGLPEDDPIIVRAKEIWWEADKQFCYDRDIIATVVFNEAGYGCSDRHMELVAAVVWNRVKSDEFPNTVYEVVVDQGQYHSAYADADSYHGKRARRSDVWKKCQEIATKALMGEIECPDDVFFQANFVQGTEIYETHYTNYSTTWFCYG